MEILVNVVSVISAITLLLGTYVLITDFSWKLVGLVFKLAIAVALLNIIWRI